MNPDEPGAAGTSPPTGPDAPGETDFERRLVERMSFEFLREQRRARRWNTFFKLLIVAYVAALTIVSLRSSPGFGTFGDDRVTALVDLQGVIAHDTEASADNIVTGLRAAFEDDATAGVILRINSPGGSPVQAGYINDEIYRLREKYPDIPLYAVIEDVCASGGYYVAAAADRIYADKASLVGSIGVRMDGFGFVDEDAEPLRSKSLRGTGRRMHRHDPAAGGDDTSGFSGPRSRDPPVVRDTAKGPVEERKSRRGHDPAHGVGVRPRPQSRVDPGHG